MTGRRLLLGNDDVRLAYVVADAVSPRATTYRIVPDGTVRLYAIEANSHIGPPRRLLSRHGQLLEHAPYCERDFRLPVGPRRAEGENVEVYIKHRGPGGVVGTFHTLPNHPFDVVGRKVDYHPLAVPVPYSHSNVDSDEVMFYCGGDYEARKGSGIGQGSISLHPGGHPHGPQPGAMERSIGAESFDELAVMVDTFRPLQLGEAGRATDDGTYAYSWEQNR